jgi:hypothetical protein
MSQVIKIGHSGKLLYAVWIWTRKFPVNGSKRKQWLGLISGGYIKEDVVGMRRKGETYIYIISWETLSEVKSWERGLFGSNALKLT